MSKARDVIYGGDVRDHLTDALRFHGLPGWRVVGAPSIAYGRNAFALVNDEGECFIVSVANAKITDA